MFIPTLKILSVCIISFNILPIQHNIASMASNVDAKSVVEDITSSTTKLDAKQSTNTPSTTASSSCTNSENYFTANEQHQEDSESEEEQQSQQSDDESMNNNDDDNSDAMSEYSYCISDDGEDDDEEQEVYDHTKKSNKIQHQVSVTHAGAKRKGKLLYLLVVLYSFAGCVLFV